MTLSLTYNDGVARRRGQRRGRLWQKGPSWFLEYRLYDSAGDGRREAVRIGAATGPGKLSRRQAERIAWDEYLSKVDELARRPRAALTLAQFWAQYYEPALVRRRPSTAHVYRSVWDRHIRPVAGDVPLVQISPAVAQAIADRIQPRYSAAFVRVVVNVFSAIYDRAMRLQCAPAPNPARAVELPDPKPARARFALNPAQVTAILGGLREPYRLAVRVALAGALGAAELFGLRWRALNLTAAPAALDLEVLPPYSLAVVEDFTAGSYGPVKRPSRRRIIPLDPELVAALSMHRAGAKFTGPADPVFAAPAGKPIQPYNAQSRILAPLGRALGLPGPLGWHTFRRTAITWSQYRAAVGDRRALSGHASLSMLDHYTLADFERLRALVGEIDRLATGANFDEQLTNAARKPN